MESKFTGSVLGFLGMKMLALPMLLLGIVSLGILWAWYRMKLHRWITMHTWVDGRQLRFDGRTMEFWVRGIIWMFFSTITFGIYTIFFLGPRRQHWFASRTHVAQSAS